MDVGALALAHTEFVLDLYKAVAKCPADENAFLSPLSIGLALAMEAAGARGTTLQQMASCLKPPIDDLMHKFTTPQGRPDGRRPHTRPPIVVRQPQLGRQNQPASRICSTTPTELKLPPSISNTRQRKARKRVNKLAEYETHGKIANILPPTSVTSDTRLILANAIYCKGTWTKPFDESMTEDCDFFPQNETTIKVPMMQSTDDQCVFSHPPPAWTPWTEA